LGRVRQLTGDHRGAAEAYTEALATYRDLGSRSGEAWALNRYAALLAATGDLARALAAYRHALGMNRELDMPDDEAIALEGIGECLLTAGDSDAGAAHLHQALEIFERLGMRPDVGRVQARLAGLTARVAQPLTPVRPDG
jgi:tetratricopeptide (TPR) repeat protein